MLQLLLYCITHIKSTITSYFTLHLLPTSLGKDYIYEDTIHMDCAVPNIYHHAVIIYWYCCAKYYGSIPSLCSKTAGILDRTYT